MIRAGFGIYPNQAAYSIVTNLAQNLPFFVTKTVNSAATLSPSFTTENALTANTVGTVGGNNLDHDFKIEYNEVWNLNLERELTSGTMLSLAYIGSRTVHADSATVLNVPLPGPGAIAARRPIPQLSQINDIRWNGWATYHALTLGAKRRFTKGLMFDANWTWSHSIDDASDPGATLNEANLPQNVYDLAAEKASSSFDHRHRVVVSFIYQLPLPDGRRGWMHALLGRMAGRREFHGAVGRAVHREHLQRSGQYRRRPGAAPQHFGQSERRPEDAAAMVQYVGVLAAGAVTRSGTRRAMP